MPRFVKTILPVTWGGLVLLSMAALTHYEFQPGTASASVPADWPQASHIARDSSRLTLVMFLHPQCPCSRATLSELAQLMSRASDSLSVHVVFVAPRQAPAGWTSGDLWRQAAAIPGVMATIDPGEAEAHAFGATTSGDVSVFDAAGRLVFKGGITDGRGHEGDNAGLDALLALTRGEHPLVSRTSVFGCPLDD
jgi:hypothetical protein